MLTTGATIFLGIALLMAKLPRRMMLRALHHDIAIDILVSVLVLIIHWGTFSEIMAATVAGLLTSLFTSAAKKLFGPMHRNVFYPGLIHVDVRLRWRSGRRNARQTCGRSPVPRWSYCSEPLRGTPDVPEDEHDQHREQTEYHRGLGRMFDPVRREAPAARPRIGRLFAARGKSFTGVIASFTCKRRCASAPSTGRRFSSASTSGRSERRPQASEVREGAMAGVAASFSTVSEFCSRLSATAGSSTKRNSCRSSALIMPWRASASKLITSFQ